MAEQMVMARLVRRTDEGLVIRPVGRLSERPHSACNPLSWCQPPEIALAALQKLYPLR